MKRRIRVTYELEFLVDEDHSFDEDRLAGYNDWLADEATFDFGEVFLGVSDWTQEEREET
jgi:hypothetical protein